MKAIVITHKETEFYFISSELALKWILFFVIVLWTVDLSSGLVAHLGYLIRLQVTHTGFTSETSPSSFPFLFRERWAALAVIYNKRERSIILVQRFVFIRMLSCLLYPVYMPVAFWPVRWTQILMAHSCTRKALAYNIGFQD